MLSLPPVSIWAVLLATAVSFGFGGLYWARLAPPLARSLRVPAGPESWPRSALAIGFLTRVVQAVGIGWLLGYAGVSNPWLAALFGIGLYAAIIMPLIIGQHAFMEEEDRWRRFLLGAAQQPAEFAIMGAIVTLWR
ncbi:DUF1761 domain-containing protein [Sinomonas sp. ASV486]|uniref:DUF1761 domain-containing protein n=1 Tax=Sinomonas sp. ASV486 TaxID=3051170 RepID=UPI0027DB5F68|nr:DUF1761 domain-containing protein [Sinomonas sp. ASV486]MDQ4491342.1 DUF1761 domain-containing protein [Sinomonas sp. ASV486]